MITVARFQVPEEAAGAFADEAGDVLRLLGKQPGFVRGRLARSLDEPGLWALVTEWDSVGSYRRGIGAYDVKLAATPLMALSIPEAGAFEVVVTADEAQAPATGPAARAR
jgi:hypothetical protein